jgi:hypothetical protein
VTPHEYCTGVCGAKCCVMNVPDEGVIPCPRLNDDKSCSVYQQRYAEGMPDLVVVGYFKSRRYKTIDGDAATRPFWCGRIEQLYAAGQIPNEVAAQCCVIHPELLNQEKA